MNIFICDDREPESISAALDVARQSAAVVPEPEAIFTDPNLIAVESGRRDLAVAIEELYEVANQIITGGVPTSTSFDGADIVLLDYGLTALKRSSGGPRLTADHIAGYIRAFSNASYVISLNRLIDVDFDLKYLVGDFETKSDLALNTPHLEEPGLWTGIAKPGAFCPWYWPRLDMVAARRKKQIEILESQLDQPLLQILGMPDEVIPHISHQAIAFLSPRAEGSEAHSNLDVRLTTAWHHFRSSNRTLVKNDREELVKSFGGDIKSEEIPDDPRFRRIVARVVAAELEFWFRRDIMGAQKVLIDAPHLQVRYPFRTGGDGSPDIWNSTTVPGNAAPYGLDGQLFNEIPDKAKYIGQPWIDRPAFWLPVIERESGISALLESNVRNNDIVFCEDTRRFLPRGNCFRFQTEIGKGIDVRYVEYEGDTYSPRTLFAR